MTGEGNGRTPVHSPRTIVHLIRHGEVHNPGKILYGRLPGYRLSDRGRAMAEATAEAFAGHDVAYVACSPLQRTRETCEPVTRVTGLEPVIDPDVLEAGNTFEGLHVRGWDSDLWNPRYWRACAAGVPSWGEPYEEIADRMLRRSTARARPRRAGRRSSSPTSCAWSPRPPRPRPAAGPQSGGPPVRSVVGDLAGLPGRHDRRRALRGAGRASVTGPGPGP